MLLLAANPPLAGPIVPVDPTEQLRLAKATYEYGDYAGAAKLLEPLTEARSLERTQDQIEAYRLLGLSHYFLNHADAAVHAFVDLLSLDPDFQLDPLYVPPQAVAFLDTVRRNNKDLLDPIRQRRRATLDAAAQEEAARQRFLSQGAAAPPRIIRERIDRPSKLVAWIPFGAGQFQNGDVGLGVTLAVTELVSVAAATSCYVWIAASSQNGFFPSSTYPTALAVRGVQIGSEAAFVGLWAFGVIQALATLRPARIIPEEVPAEPNPTPASPKLGVGFGPLRGGGVGSVQLSF
jgi:hypothetical protein